MDVGITSFHCLLSELRLISFTVITNAVWCIINLIVLYKKQRRLKSLLCGNENILILEFEFCVNWLPDIFNS